jgi:hypothetical protein
MENNKEEEFFSEDCKLTICSVKKDFINFKANDNDNNHYVLTDYKPKTIKVDSIYAALRKVQPENLQY